jgi:hypothetical protein
MSLAADVSELVGEKFQNFGRLAVDAAGRASGSGALVLCLTLDGARHGFIEEGPHRLISGQDAFFYQGAKERHGGADGRQTICAIMECAHFMLSGRVDTATGCVTSSIELGSSHSPLSRGLVASLSVDPKATTNPG